MGAPRVSEAAIQRAISAAQSAGIPIGAVIVNNVDGTVRVETQAPSRSDGTPVARKAAAPKQWGEGS